NVLKTEFPEVYLVTHEKNLGFAEAIHTGVRAAKTELLFLLNSDVEVQSDLLSPLVKYFEDPNTFSVNPLIYDESGEVKRHSWNLRQLKNGHLKITSWTLPEALDRRNSGEKLPSAYAHGGSFMVRKSMFMELNGFHPIFKPFYSEDYDLGLRAWRKGWASYFEPQVHIVHQSQGSIRSNVKMNFVKCIRRRNRYLIEWIHLSLPDLLFKVMPFTLFQLLGELLIFDKVNLKGFYLALLKFKEVLQARNELHSSSKYNLTDVLKHIKSNQ
ncbi:MAG: glycosyltransferase, partial [Nitrosomonadales bacterium]|nr:glycosyltransferase [Nitrosomonadales bacterium]